MIRRKNEHLLTGNEVSSIFFKRPHHMNISDNMIEARYIMIEINI